MEKKIVLEGILIENEEKDIAHIVEEFKKEGMEVSFIDRYNTLPGQNWPRGRTDLVFSMDSKSITKAAIHPWHLNGLFRWAEDYYTYNESIVPFEKRGLFKVA